MNRRFGAAAFVVLAVAGCTNPHEPPRVPPPCLDRTGPLAVALGAHANAPAPAPLPQAISDAVTQAADSGQQITLIGVDGRPAVSWRGQFTTSAVNEIAEAADLAAFQAAVGRTILALRADDAQTDLVTALDLAARSTDPAGTVVVIDSGLSTAGPLSFTERGMLAAEPDDVVAYLRDNDMLPDLTGRAVVFAGLGDTVAPQAELGIHHRRNLVEIWRAIATAAKAGCVSVLEQPRSGTAAADLTVSPVPVPAAPEPACGVSFFSNDGDVGFLPDSSKLRDPRAARAVLRAYADRIIRSGARVRLVGMTASAGTENGRLSLSGKRADVVRDMLVTLGVPAQRIQTKGVGTHSPYHVPDLGRHGELLPGPAARNRAVVIEVVC